MTQDVEQGIAAELDARVLQRLNTLQDSVRAWLPSAAPLSVADALRLCANAHSGTEDWSEAVPVLAEEALTALLAAREREGKRLATMLLDRVKQLRTLAQQAVPMVPLLVEQQRQRFMERWKEAMALAEGAVPGQPSMSDNHCCWVISVLLK